MIADVVHIVLAANHRYLNGLLATMSSMILFASDRSRLQFHVFADGLNVEDCDRVRQLAVRCGCINECQFLYPDMTKIVHSFTAYNSSHTTFLRLFLPELLTWDWVIYSDVDTLWFRDVCQLWNERDDAYSVMWSRDVLGMAEEIRKYSLKFNPGFDVEHYACAGVILMNLSRMRSTGFVRKCMAFVEKWGTPYFVDQDILNTICRDDSKIIDQRWNCMRPDRLALDGVVIHFNGLGPSFNEPFSGWHLQYTMWYRFFYDIVLQNPRKTVCGSWKQTLFALLGIFYPNPRVMSFLLAPFGRLRIDQVSRQIFFAWLLRHNDFRKRWMCLMRREDDVGELQ